MPRPNQQVTRTNICPLDSTMPPFCACSNPHVTIRAIPEGYFQESPECHLRVVIPAHLVTRGEHEWLNQRGI